MVLQPYFLDDLKARVLEAVKEESARVAGGQAADWSDYRYRTGILHGLSMLGGFIDDLTEDKEP